MCRRIRIGAGNVVYSVVWCPSRSNPPEAKKNKKQKKTKKRGGKPSHLSEVTSRPQSSDKTSTSTTGTYVTLFEKQTRGFHAAFPHKMTTPKGRTMEPGTETGMPGGADDSMRWEGNHEWRISGFPTLWQRGKKHYSDVFTVGGCPWRLSLYPKGNTAIKGSRDHVALLSLIHI